MLDDLLNQHRRHLVLHPERTPNERLQDLRIGDYVSATAVHESGTFGTITGRVSQANNSLPFRLLGIAHVKIGGHYNAPRIDGGWTWSYHRHTAARPVYFPPSDVEAWHTDASLIRPGDVVTVRVHDLGVLVVRTGRVDAVGVDWFRLEDGSHHDFDVPGQQTYFEHPFTWPSGVGDGPAVSWTVEEVERLAFGGTGAGKGGTAAAIEGLLLDSRKGTPGFLHLEPGERVVVGGPGGGVDQGNATVVELDHVTNVRLPAGDVEAVYLLRFDNTGSVKPIGTGIIRQLG